MELFTFSVVGLPDAPALTEDSDLSENTLTVSTGLVFASSGSISTIKANIARDSGTVTFYVMRPNLPLLFCDFEIVAEWTTDVLMSTGWTEVRLLTIFAKLDQSVD